MMQSYHGWTREKYEKPQTSGDVLCIAFVPGILRLLAVWFLKQVALTHTIAAQQDKLLDRTLFTVTGNHPTTTLPPQQALCSCPRSLWVGQGRNYDILKGYWFVVSGRDSTGFLRMTER